MSPTSTKPEAILSKLQSVGSAYAEGTPGSREQLLNLSHALISSLELPSEAIQRMGWAEVTEHRVLAQAQVCMLISHHSPPEPRIVALLWS